MHPLVRDATRAAPGSPSHYDDLNIAISLTVAAVGSLGSPEDPAEWPTWQLLAPHVIYLLAAASRPGYPEEAAASAAIAAYPAARYLASQGLHAQAEASYRHILATRHRVLGPDHPFTLNTRYQIAYEMAERGDHTGAEAQFRDILAAQVLVFDPDHPSTLATRHGIARMTSERGDHEGAETQYQGVLADRLRVLGPDHPSTLGTRHQIARIAASYDDRRSCENAIEHM